MRRYAAPRSSIASRAAPAGPAPGADSWSELEEVVDRLARLVLHADALAERTARLPVPPEGVDPERANRLLRLRAGADLGSRALQAAVRVDVLTANATHLRRLLTAPPARPGLVRLTGGPG